MNVVLKAAAKEEGSVVAVLGVALRLTVLHNSDGGWDDDNISSSSCSVDLGASWCDVIFRTQQMYMNMWRSFNCFVFLNLAGQK